MASKKTNVTLWNLIATALFAFCGVFAQAQSPADLADLYAWYNADLGRFDATSGGSSVTADKAIIKRHEDQSGNARHVTQGTDARCPRYDATKGLIVSAINTDGFFSFPGSFTLDRRDMSLFAVVEISSLRQPYIAANGAYKFLFDGGSNNCWGFIDTNLSTVAKLTGYPVGGDFAYGAVPLAPTRCLVGWVGGASAHKVWIDDSYTSFAALDSGNTTLSGLLGYSGTGWPSQCAYKDVAVYDRALSDVEVRRTLLRYAYIRGVARTRLHQVVIDGDSISHGAASDAANLTLNRGWPALLTISGSTRVRNCAQSGATMATQTTEAVNKIDVLHVSGETNLVVPNAMGNDIHFNDSNLATLQSQIQVYCAARYATGFRCVVQTITPRNAAYFTAPRETTRTNYNTWLRSNYQAFAIGLIDFAGDSLLDDPDDTDYYSDGIHPTQLGQARMAVLASAVLDPLIPRAPVAK